MSSYRRNGFRRRTEFEPLKKFVVISMEGAGSEPHYFKEFKTSREAETQVRLVPNSNHRSHPIKVFQRLQKDFRKYSLKNNDEGWIVIDRDAWSDDDLDSVYSKAKTAGFKIALSNPCFELWLYFHLRDNRPFNDRHDCQRKLAEILPGYSPNSKGKFATKPLIENLDKAIDRAKRSNVDQQDTWPKYQTTHVYYLVQRLRSS